MDLAGWREGGSKRAIAEFVESATQPGAAFAPLADRIATFDNDGTLWVKQPAPPQFDFLLRVWSQEAGEAPSLAERQPYKAIVERDPAFFEGLMTQDPQVMASLEGAVARSWAGSTPDAFEAQVHRWADTVKQPRFGIGYTDLVYRPMLELFDYLKAHDFRVFVCSGGGRDFMRVFAEEIWSLPKENVIGTASAYEYTDGRIVRTDRMLGGLALGAGKPEHIYAQTGRLPLLAAGNADVDIEMLTTASLALLISHDDAEREYAYTKAAERRKPLATRVTCDAVGHFAPRWLASGALLLSRSVKPRRLGVELRSCAVPGRQGVSTGEGGGAQSLGRLCALGAGLLGVEACRVFGTVHFVGAVGGAVFAVDGKCGQVGGMPGGCRGRSGEGGGRRACGGGDDSGRHDGLTDAYGHELFPLLPRPRPGVGGAS
ncbi:HAD family hydrolase [Streptomyces sp. RKAG293]|uniref:HAD family hydrolase n=1 Tax=Streptomyces sp. RKAG293 TaxID=2893403 RepID=UPI002034189E|nr:HAD family hydrolase [Streptomyces sp. RKAG293]MCM2416705.1 haloacid dehalogenase-like hydrolase [Streptomyces sp. RKAG293]